MMDTLDIVVAGLVTLSLAGLAVTILWPLEPRRDRMRGRP